MIRRDIIERNLPVWKPSDVLRSPEDWVVATAQLPIAFAQVREDPLIDANLLNRVPRSARVLMVASGGETAAYLSSLGCESLHLVDVNPSQLALCRLKFQLLETTEPSDRLALLGYEPLPSEVRSGELRWRLFDCDLAEDALGPPGLIAEFGPDYCGRYEWLFARMRDALHEVRPQLTEMLSLGDQARQQSLIAPETELGIKIKAAFDEVMEQSRLVKIFGTDATANRVQPFADHFFERTQWALASTRASKNPFLHQILLGKFTGPRWPWLDLPCQSTAPPIRFTQSSMASVLQSQPDRSLDLIHLSNILDWIPPKEAQCVLQNAWRCLRPKGLVVIRQLNSRLAIPEIPCGLKWMPALGDELLKMDRSFFYRALHVGVRE